MTSEGQLIALLAFLFVGGGVYLMNVLTEVRPRKERDRG